MGDGGRLALAIVVFFAAMVFFFFAFHPGGVSDISNPTQMLQWLFGEFNNITGATTTTDATLTASESSALNYPGYTSTGTSNVGSTPTGSGVTVD